MNIRRRASENPSANGAGSMEYFQHTMNPVSFRWHILPAIVKMLFPEIRPGKTARLPIKSVVCLRPGKLGDMIAATPLLSSLKQWGGVERLAVLCSAANEVVIRHDPCIDEIRVVNFHRVGGVISAIRWLRRRNFDAIIDLTPGFSRTNFLIVKFAGAAIIRAGVNKGTLSSHYHYTVEETGTHVAERMLKLGAVMVEKPLPGEAPMRIFCSGDDTETARKFISLQAAGAPLIAVNLSAGRKERQWDYERYRTLCLLLSSRPGEPFRIALLSVGDTWSWAERLSIEVPCCLAVPQRAFLSIVAFLAHCRLLISPDTALVHAAAAQGVPVVGLYTADKENATRWHPYRIPCAVVQSSGPSGIETINDIEPETVHAAVMRLLAETAPGSAGRAGAVRA